MLLNTLHGGNNANLIIVPSSESSNGSTTAPSFSVRSLTNAVTCVLLNTRPICNKPVTDKEHMIGQKADLMFLTETWCKPCITAVLIELTPPVYSFIGECHSSNREGGVGLVYKSAFKFRKTTTKRHDTFEYLDAKSTQTCELSSLTARRPPPSSRSFKISQRTSCYTARHPHCRRF